MIEALSGKKILCHDDDVTCDDTKVLLQALLSNAAEIIDVKNSGTAMLFMTAYLAQKEGEWLLTGSETLKKRSIGELVRTLRKLGADIEFWESEDRLPLKIYGKQLKGGKITVDASSNSQFISALMLIAPLLPNGLAIKLEGTNSFPHLWLTKQIMGLCGAEVKLLQKIITISNKRYVPKLFSIESDWSAAVFWYGYLLVSNHKEIILKEITKRSLQTDKIVKKIFNIFGIKSSIRMNYLFLEKEEKELPEIFEYDFGDYPDLVPIMVAVCCLKNIRFDFHGIENLRIKENNCIQSLVIEISKLGFILTETRNSVGWDGETCEMEPYPIIDTHNDYRIAMVFALMMVKYNFKLLNPGATDKSYSNFWPDFERAQEYLISANGGKNISNVG
jgi:3-phosphoshikimate 1-carboxyvinyltransferase